MSTLDAVSEIGAMIDVLDNIGRETSAAAVSGHLSEIWAAVSQTFPAGDSDAIRIGKLIVGLGGRSGSFTEKVGTLKGALVGLKMRSFDRQG